MKFFRFIIVGIIILTNQVFQVYASDSSVLNLSDKRVLFISSYNSGFDTLPDQVAGIMSVFEEYNIHLDIDYMDTKQYGDEQTYLNYFKFLEDRLNNVEPYDLILVGDDNALQFSMDNQQMLFDNTPIVFFCVNDVDRASNASSTKDITGIIESISVDENLRLALDLFPNTIKIIGIVDNTKTGIGDANRFMEASKNFVNTDFELLNFSDYTHDEFESELNKVSDDTLVFYMSMFRDAENIAYTIDESSKILTDNLNVPYFRMTIGGIGDGAIGGEIVSYFEQGKVAANIAVNVLSGSDINSLKLISDSPNKYYFDYNVLTKYGISKDRLPYDSIVLNEPVDYLDLYKEFILGVASLLVVFSSIMLILYRDNLKLKKKDKELKESNKKLITAYESVREAEEELRNNYEILVESKKQLNESEERYKYLAYTDTLTGLKNRTALMNYLDIIVQNDDSWYFLYIDLDDFKYINDSRGHEQGDQVLKEISVRLKSFENRLNYLARLGGDEFVLIIDRKINIEEFTVKLKEKISEPIQIGNSRFYLSISIGISEFPLDGDNRHVLYRKADIAMYHSKNLGKGNHNYFTINMEQNIEKKIESGNKLKHAIRNEEFELYYQPQIDIESEAIVGVECLMRWKDIDGTFISPGEFIPIAEKEGLIYEIGKWVYQEAITTLLKLKNDDYVNPYFSVNVSAAELMEDSFVSMFLTILNGANIKPGQVAVEITETVFIDSTAKAINQLEALRQHGISIHLDDFGTGYSSLNYLVNLPLDVIKIDREFTRNIITNSQKRNLTKFIIDVAHNLGYKVIAEGVETLEQYDLLKKMKCDKIQGYYISKPMPYDELTMFLQNSHTL